MKNLRFKLIVRTAIFFASLVAGVHAGFAQAANNKSCLAYEAAIVRLDGTLGRRAVVNASGQRQTIWIAKLSAPVCVDADSSNEMNAAVERVREVQLVFNAEQIRRYRPLVNQKVELKGTLFAAHTQHHFTEVLMIVSEAKKK